MEKLSFEWDYDLFLYLVQRENNSREQRTLSVHKKGSHCPRNLDIQEKQWKQIH